MKKSKYTWLIGFFLIVLFLFLRLYKIKTSLLFFNDMGRDFSILLDWYETGRPPLLGPQTSAFSFNQSAIYFYGLMPVFILSGQSSFSSIYTVILFYLVVFGWGLHYFHQNKSKLLSVLSIGFLATIHPQVIIQNRFVWNPSFLLPLLMISLFSLMLLLEKFSYKKVAIFSFASAAAISLSYSVIPTIFSLLILSSFFFKKKSVIMFLGTFLAGIILNFPTIFFEIRHGFVLTKLLFTGQKLTQTASSFSSKSLALTKYVANTQSIWVGGLLILFLISVFFFSQKIYQQNHQKNKSKQLLFFTAAFILTIIITFIAPINIESHYIFGILSLLIFFISLLPKKLLIPSLAILSFFWLKPTTIESYFTPARRTISDLESCYAKVCQEETSPLYVSMQSGILPYHNAPEHRYFMRQAGCKVLNIEESQDRSSKMAVVIDDSTYEHGKTAYNELTLFGKSKEKTKYSCQANLEVVILEKIKN